MIFDYFCPSYRKKRFDFLKKNEVWITVWFSDPLAIPAALLFSRLKFFTPIFTPNAISFFSFIFFYLSVSIMFLSPSFNILASLGFFLSMLLDDIDGKLARLDGQTSKFGVAVDAFFDMLNHGLGLSLIGLALSIQHHDPIIFAIILPYALYLGAMHINHIAMAFDGKNISTPVQSHKDSWMKLCDRCGLIYSIYTDSEVIYLMVLFIGVNLNHPVIFLTVSIYLRFLLGWVWPKF